MPAPQASLTGWSRGGLALLCLLLGLSLATRLYGYFFQSQDNETVIWDEAGGPINLGRGVSLPRAAAVDRMVRVDGCATPSSIYFFKAGPYGVDASTVGSPEPVDRVVYIYDGWTIEGGVGTLGINAIYFARKVYARVMLNRKLAADDIAIKIVVPAGCNASTADVMTAFRRDLQS